MTKARIARARGWMVIGYSPRKEAMGDVYSVFYCFGLSNRRTTGAEDDKKRWFYKRCFK
jgi:hypothetical protein